MFRPHNDFTFEQEQKILTEIDDIRLRRSQQKLTANQRVAEIAGDLVKMAPTAQPHLVLPIAKAVASGVLTRDAADNLVMNVQKKVLSNPVTFSFDKKSGGIFDWVDDAWDATYGAAKRGINWTKNGVFSSLASSLEFTGNNIIDPAYTVVKGAAKPTIAYGMSWLDQAQNLGAMAVQSLMQQPSLDPVNTGLAKPNVVQYPDTEKFGYVPPEDPFDIVKQFKSTTSAAYLSGGYKGNGFFINEEARKRQLAYQKEVRGTVAGHAVTLGRGLALSVAEPDTPIYNIVSGAIDAYVASRIPLSPGTKPLTNIVKTGLADVNIARLVGSNDEAIPLLRSLAGLTGKDTQVVRAKLPEFLDSVVGRWIMDEAAKTNTIEDARKLFPGADIWWWQKIKESTPDTVRQLFEENLGLRRGLQIEKQFNISRWSDVKTAMFRSNTAVWSGMERLAGKRAGREIMIYSDNPRDLTVGVSNLIEYLKSLRIPFEQRTAIIDELSDVVVNNPLGFRETATKIKNIVDEAIIDRSRLGRIAPGVGGEIRVDKEYLAKLTQMPQEIRDGWQLYGLTDPNEGFSTVLGLKPKRMTKKAMAASAMEGTAIDGTKGSYLIADDWAMLTSEARRIGMMLPDPNRVYRATSPFNFLFEKDSIFFRRPDKFGNPRGLTVLADYIQNDIWKRFIVMSIANLMRNTTDETAREMFAPGIRLGPTHPLEHIATAIHGDFGKYLGNIEGETWADVATGINKKVYDEYLDAIETHMQGTVGAEHIQNISAQTGSWAKVNNKQGQQYIQGIADNIHLLSNDPLARKVAAGWVFGDAQTPDTIAYWVTHTTEGKQYLRDMNMLHGNKNAYNIDTKTWERVNIEYADKAGNPNLANLQKHVDLYIRPRIEAITAGHKELKNVIATADRMGQFNYEGQSHTAFETMALGRNDAVAVLDYNENFLKLIHDAVNDKNYSFPTWVKARQHLKGARVGAAQNPISRMRDHVVTRYFSEMLGVTEATLNRSPAFRQYYHNYLEPLLDELAPGEAQAIYNNIKYAHQKWFEDELDTLKNLHKNPDGTFAHNGKAISAAERQSMIDEATRELADRRKNFESKQWLTGWSWPERYIGSKETWQKIVDRAEGTVASTGKLTAEQASTAAKAYALDATKKLFYDASERNNMWEVLRIVFPFGKAWKEVTRKWTETLAGSGENLSRAAITYQGVKGADPDADGRGFVYTDPITGEQMFNYPLGSWTLPVLAALSAGSLTAMVSPFSVGKSFLAGAAAGGAAGIYGREQLKGTQYEMAAPLKSLNMIFNVLPGFGPVAQMALDKLLPYKPKYDDIRKFVSPYGTPAGPTEVLKAFPWAEKLVRAIEADPENDSVFSSMYIESYAALLATGKYDRTNADEMDRLDKEARSTAQWLTIARSVGQFIGPSRPTPVIQIPTKYEGELTVNDVKMYIKDGSIPSNVLARVFRDFQERDYDTAVPKFLDAFSWNLDMFVNGKSYTVSEGLRADKQFGDWEREHPGVIQRNKEVYGYFATTGTDFDRTTYLRQIETGARERWTSGKAKREDAEYVVGNALYRQALREVGPEITDTERGKLAQYKLYLKDQYPGYATRVTDINKLSAKIERLRVASNDRDLRDNEVAIATRAYFDARDEIIDAAQNRREQPVAENILGGKKNTDLRQKLREFGEYLVGEYPQFGRVFEEVFLYEVDEE